MSHYSKLTNALVALIDQGSQSELPTLAQIAERADVPLSVAQTIFPNSYEVLVAVSEIGMLKLIDVSTRAVVQVDAKDPVAQMKALGGAYLDWAFNDLRSFRVCGNRRLIDVAQEPRVARYYDSMRRLIVNMLDRAIEIGLLSQDDDPEMLLVACRAYVYGLARMVADDHFREWVADKDPTILAKKAFDDYIDRVVGVKSASAHLIATT